MSSKFLKFVLLIVWFDPKKVGLSLIVKHLPIIAL